VSERPANRSHRLFRRTLAGRDAHGDPSIKLDQRYGVLTRLSSPPAYTFGSHPGPRCPGRPIIATASGPGRPFQLCLSKCRLRSTRRCGPNIL